MLAEKNQLTDIIAIVKELSLLNLEQKFIPILANSPLILDALERIYQLHRENKLCSTDSIKIKEVFNIYFKFFSKEFSSKNIFLAIVFVLCCLATIAICLVPLLFPLFILIAIILVATYFTLNNDRLDLTKRAGVHKGFEQEILILKYKLNELKNELLDRYMTESTSCSSGVRRVTSIANDLASSSTIVNLPPIKKSVSFSSKHYFHIVVEEKNSASASANSTESVRYIGKNNQS